MKNVLSNLLKSALLLSIAVLLFTNTTPKNKHKPTAVKRYLYVATPGIRNYLEYGGHGLLVFDIDNNYRFVKRIPTAGLDTDGKPINVKGICASISTNSIYISTIQTLQCIDLTTEKVKWERKYDEGCDRMAISPDGKTIYLPTFEKDHWSILDATTGDIKQKIVLNSGAHNTLFGLNGKEVYLEGLRSPYLTVVNAQRPTETRQVGPFSASIRPFTVNGKQTLCYVNVNELLGFEIGDLKTGKMLHRVEVSGFQKGPVKRHACPSHGVGLTPDEKEVWVVDGANQQVHFFDATALPPRQIGSLPLRDQPGWITFSLDGKHGYPSTGEIIDVATHKIITTLKDENGQGVHSEKMMEIHFNGPKPITLGDQFGLGRVR
ncbi:YncE family protein [Runella sp.]|uniref:YncE family protein n=1 Tax=Runella sp. TaxID=1960881 RepID=UPI003D130F1D